MITDTHMPVRRVTIASASLTAIVAAALVVASAVAAFAEVPVPRPNPMREAPGLPPPPPPTVRAAPAAPTCPDHAAVAAHLLEGWSERRVAAGLRQDGVLLELYASRSGSWTAVITSPDGTSCMVGSGEGFRSWPFARLGKGGA